MTLSLPVCHPHQPGHVLLRPGFTLDAPTIRRLAELKVGRVWIRYPALDSVMRFVSPEVLTAHASLTQTLGESLDNLARDAHAELEYRSYATAVRLLVAKLIEHPASRLLVAEVAGSDRALAAHSGNVCFLSLLMGLKLEGYLMIERSKVGPLHSRNIENLGVGALLHDIGVLGLPPEVVDAHNASGNEDNAAWREHVRLGYEMVRGRVEPTAAVAILHHHQRFDGAGYPMIEPGHVESRTLPRPLKGNEIHVFARIIAVADLFDRMKHPTGSDATGTKREPAPTVRILRHMLGLARRGLIDPVVFKGLLHVVPAFAPGSIVTLDTGRQCVVTGFDPMRPCRPMVRELRCPISKLSPDTDDLGEAFDLAHSADTIAHAEGHDVEAEIFDAVDPSEFDIRVLSGVRSAALHRTVTV